jgi:dephospho-CoA kinase
VVIQIGLTGGIGAGKSTVADGLVDRGAILIDADRIVRELQAPGAPVFRAMVERWGQEIVAPDGSLDRAAVAAIVFNDAQELRRLNAIVHPAVRAEMTASLAAVADTGAVVVLDIPLLVDEQGSTRPEYRDLAAIVVVDTDPELAVERLVAHRGFSEADARARVARQAGREHRLAAADYVVDNSGTIEALDAELDRLWVWIGSLGGGVTPRR